MSLAKLIIGFCAIFGGITGVILKDPLLSYQGIINAILFVGLCVDKD